VAVTWAAVVVLAVLALLAALRRRGGGHRAVVATRGRKPPQGGSGTAPWQGGRFSNEAFMAMCWRMHDTFEAARNPPSKEDQRHQAEG
jgi:hypothetical protein